MRISHIFSWSHINRLLSEEEGQTLVEYGLLISLIALATIAAITLFGQKVSNMWGNNANKYPDANNIVSGH